MNVVRIGLRATIVVLVVFAGVSAHAVPTAFYNPATGAVRLGNDFQFALQAIVLNSGSGRLTSDTDLALDIPGATRDTAYLPIS